MRLQSITRRLRLASAAAAVLVLAAGPALAANTVRIDISGGGTVNSLAIVQDATDNSNTVTTTGLAGGASIPFRGPWSSISIDQTGAGNILKSSGITSAAGSTTASLNLNYGTSATTGNNIHSLTIGQTTAPTNPSVTVNVSNTDAGNAANTITDVLDGSSLSYTLAIAGTNNTIDNTIGATGAVSMNLTADGGTAAAANTITDTITGATSANLTVAVNSSGNVITNTSDGTGDKVISVNLPVGGADGNTVVNDFTGGTGAQTSNLTVTGVTSRVNFDLEAGGAGTTSNVNLADVVGAAGAAGKLVLTQSGAGTSLALNVAGNGFTMGSTLAGGAGVVITQASAGAVLNATITAGANGYTYTITQ